METIAVKTPNFQYPMDGDKHVKEVCNLIAIGMKSKAEKLKWFSDYTGHIMDAVSYLIETYYEQGSKINVKYMVEGVAKVARIYDMFVFFNHIERTNKNHHEQNGVVFGPVTAVIAKKSADRVIAAGELLEDFEDGDPDPYQTAGGYRNWKALKGSRVEYALNSDLSVSAIFESNCMVDHYNNNIGGLSTGGGTTRYEVGERVETRCVNMGREFLDSGWKATKLKAKVTSIDATLALSMCEDFHPEFVGTVR